MGPMASQITSLTTVYSTVYSDADQRKHQSSVSLAFVDRWIPSANGQLRGKCFHLMTSSWIAAFHTPNRALVVRGQDWGMEMIVTLIFYGSYWNNSISLANQWFRYSTEMWLLLLNISDYHDCFIKYLGNRWRVLVLLALIVNTWVDSLLLDTQTVHLRMCSFHL